MRSPFLDVQLIPLVAGVNLRFVELVFAFNLNLFSQFQSINIVLFLIRCKPSFPGNPVFTQDFDKPFLLFPLCVHIFLFQQFKFIVQEHVEELPTGRDISYRVGDRRIKIQV